MRIESKILISLAVLAMVGTGSAAVHLWRFAHTPMAGRERAGMKTHEEQIFEVAQGESFRSVSRRLVEQGLIKNAGSLSFLGRITGAASRVKTGEYSVSPNQTPLEILAVLESGHSIERAITVPEGSNRFDIADILVQSGFCTREEFLKSIADPQLIAELFHKDTESRNRKTLEGYLFPDTYHVTRYTGVKGLIRVMIQHFQESYAKVQATPGWSKGNLRDDQVVTLASIVEKETGAPGDRPMVASVFLNRLRIHMPLQTDPTIIYGILDSSGKWNHNLSKIDLQTPGKWNSYLNQGLPPGPISNPGFASLLAIGTAGKTDFLYFVSRNDGTTVFSKTYNEHTQAVAKYQLDAKAREGKSWRDLGKKKEGPAAEPAGK